MCERLKKTDLGIKSMLDLVTEGPAKRIFAPEMKYRDGKYWINYSVNNTTSNRFWHRFTLSK